MSSFENILLASQAHLQSLGQGRLLQAGSIVLAAYILYRLFIYPFYVSPFRHLPEPKGASFPWAHAAIIRKQHNGETFRNWVREVPNNGIIKFRALFNRERLLLTSAEAFKEVLVTRSYDFSKPPGPTSLFRNALGNGLLVADGQIHKQQRKSLTPPFSYRHIKDLYPLFWEKAQLSSQKLAGKPGPQSALVEAKLVTVDIIGMASMGYDFNALENPDQPIVKDFKTFFENESPGFRWTFIGLDLPTHWALKVPIPQVRAARNSIISVRAVALKMVKSIKNEDGKDILAVARRSGQFDEEGLVDQIMTFLAAGHETTASALTWTTYILCQHPEIQKRLREEVRTLDPNSITASEIDALPYLNAVCSEVLRLMPSVPSTVRDAQVDTTILGMPIPKGTRLFMSPWATNADPKLWGPDAAKFKPERWLAPGHTNSGGSLTNYANLTFLHGPRSCIGKDFAKAELLCLVAAWFGRHQVRFVEGDLEPDVQGWITVHPGHGLPVIFEEVPGW